MLDDDALTAALRATHLPVEAVVLRLIEQANAAGGRDNVTAVLARF